MVEDIESIPMKDANELIKHSKRHGYWGHRNAELGVQKP